MEQLAFDKIRKTVTDLQLKGEPIEHAAFITWLDNLAKEEPALKEYRLMKHAADMAFYQAKCDSRQSRYRAKLEFHKSMFEAVMSTAVAALKSSLLINGGASVAMLGFLAALSKDNKELVVPLEFSEALIRFTLGVFFGAAATASTYFAQYNYSEKNNKRANFYRNVSIALVVASLICFIIGSYKAYSGLHFD